MNLLHMLKYKLVSSPLPGPIQVSIVSEQTEHLRLIEGTVPPDPHPQLSPSQLLKKANLFIIKQSLDEV